MATVPPISTPFLDLIQDRDGRIVSANMTPAWQQYFGQVAQFQEAVGMALNLSDIQSALDNAQQAIESTIGSTQSSIEGNLLTDVQSIIDAGASSLFGADYKGAWVAGFYAVGNVVYYSGFFYECKVTRASSHTDDPATDSTGWSLRSYQVMLTGNVNVDLTSVRTAIQNAIDAQGTASFGADYKGAWAAGIFSVGAVTYHSGAFYTCTVARVAADTDDPAIDTASWEIQVSESGGLEAAVQAAIDASAVIQFGSDYTGKWEAGVHAVGGISYYLGAFYECTQARTSGNTNPPSLDTGAWMLIQSRRQAESNSLGYANFGLDYKGAWVAGIYAVGNVSFYGGRYYECSAVRAATDTDDPATDAASWDVVGSSVKIDLSLIESTLSGLETEVGSTRTDISDALQSQIDAIGSNSYGDAYDGKWAVGAYAIERIVYWVGKFYECISARTSAHTSNPASDTTGWSVIASSVTVDLSAIETTLTGLETEISASQQAQIDAIGSNAYGNDYKGKWASGPYAIGNISFYDGKFYRVKTAPGFEAFPFLKRFSIPTAWGSGEALATLRARSVSANEDQTFVPPDPITSDVPAPSADYYMLRWRFLIKSSERWNRITLLMPDGCDDWLHVYLMRSTPGGDKTGSEIGNVKRFFFSSTSVTENSDITESDWGAVASDGYYYAMIEAYFGEKTGAERSDWRIGYRVGSTVTPPEIVNATGGLQNIDPTDYQDPATDAASWDVVDSSATIDLSSIESTLSGLETEVGSTRTDISEARQQQIDAAARIAYGEDYRGVWAAGIFALGDVTFHVDNFYECDAARVATDTDNPVVDSSSWSVIKSLKQGQAETMSGFTRGVQDTIDAQARAIFGTDYRGTWEAGDFAVADITYWTGKFYRCTVRREPTSTDNPATDTASWELTGTDTQTVIDAAARTAFGDDYTGPWEAGVHAVGAVAYWMGKFYECISARTSADTNNPASDATGWSIQDGVRSAVKEAINAGVAAVGAAQFGADYKGAWAAGIFSVGNILSFERRYYRCKVARVAANTGDPSTDTASWEIVGSAVTILAQQQSSIDAIGASQYGNAYKGKWESGVHAVGDYRSHDGRYYRCKAGRTLANTSDPASDSTGWDAVGSSFTLEGSLETATQEQIDAAARITYGEDYKGHWSAGVFAVGAVTYDTTTKKFYECDTARNASNTSNPASDSTGWEAIQSLKQDVADSLGLAGVKAQIFTNSGTWIKPEKTGFVRVFLVGGGAGGGGGGGAKSIATSSFGGAYSAKGSGGGGGAGGQIIYTDIPVAGDVIVTVGSGGPGGAGASGSGQTSSSRPPGSSGIKGGDTTFGSLLTALGGNKGGGGNGQYARGNEDRIPTKASIGVGGEGPDKGDFPSPLGSGNPAGGDSSGNGQSIAGIGRPGLATNASTGGGGGGGSFGEGGEGGLTNENSTATDGQSPEANSGSGGGGGGGGSADIDTSSGTRVGNGGDGAAGASGYVIVFWSE